MHESTSKRIHDEATVSPIDLSQLFRLQWLCVETREELIAVRMCE
jgi:hypothetical protein